MLTSPFYFNTSRNVVAAFGTLFNDIWLVRRDAQDTEIGRSKVPIAYGKKQHYIRKIHEQASKPDVNLTLPRMSFAMGGPVYDPTRQVNPLNSFRGERNGSTIGGADIIMKHFSPIPYNFPFELNVYSKNIADGLQIMEQIVPWFTPEYSLTVKDTISTVVILNDIPVVLQGVSEDDNDESGFDDNRLITWTFQFEARGYFYKPTKDTAIIKKTLIDIKNSDTNAITENIDTFVDPIGADEDDLWTAKTTIT